MVRFIKGNHFSLFTTLGVPHGWLETDSNKPQLVIFLEQGLRLLQTDVESGKRTLGEAVLLEEAMKAAGVLPNLEAVFQKIREFVLPKDYKPLLTFKLGQDNYLPLTHGQVHLSTINQTLHKPISTMIDGLNVCLSLVSDTPFSDTDVISLLKEMLAANIAADDADLYEHYQALPKEVRDRLERNMSEMEALELANSMKVGNA